MRPSDYLEIKDNWTAFQLDAALAVKGELRDMEIQQHFVENINEHILLVCKALGAKVTKRARPPRTVQPSGELPRLEDMLALLGGAGTVVVKEKKNG